LEREPAPNKRPLQDPLSKVRLARLDDGELDGDAGDDDARARRLASDKAGTAGDSQKNEPSPGEPNEGDW
jgi:hypothetical protein